VVVVVVVGGKIMYLIIWQEVAVAAVVDLL
jgi:hypothetical protein